MRKIIASLVETVKQGARGSSAAPWLTKDPFDGGEVLADQAGAGGVLTFTFANSMELIWARADGGDARADPFGGTPTASLGILLEDGIPTPITMQTSTLKVYAAGGVTVRVYGYRHTT